MPTHVSASSVTSFKLESSRPSSDLVFPDLMLSAPNLRTLELVKIVLPKGNSSGELALCCPVLETLVLKNCGHKHLKVLNLSIDQLKKLEIDNRENDREADDVLGDCKLELHTPNLSSFVYRGDMYADSSFENVVSLSNVDVSFKRGKSFRNLSAWLPKATSLLEASYAIKFLRGLCNAKTLALEEFQIFSVPNELGELITSHSNLKKLELRVYLGSNASVTRLASLLNSCSSIETLVLQIIQHSDTKEKAKPLLPSQCPLNHLKHVAVHRLEGLNREFEFLRYLFDNVKNLERMVITGYVVKNLAVNRTTLMKFHDKLMKLSQRHPNVEVSFEIL